MFFLTSPLSTPKRSKVLTFFKIFNLLIEYISIVSKFYSMSIDFMNFVSIASLNIIMYN